MKLNHTISHHRQIQADSQTKIKRSNCQPDENSDDQTKGYLRPNLPEEIWSHIHSLLPMRDAARVACVSWAFLRSWRCHPHLSFSEETLSLNKNACGEDENANDFTNKVDHILKKHSGIGVKTLRFQVDSVFNLNDHLNSWLQTAIKPGIEELCLCLPLVNTKYSFPCSLLSEGTRDSLRYLYLGSCNFHPTVRLGFLRSLTRLRLSMVGITGDELGVVLSSSCALERLELNYCREIIFLKIPCLQQLSYLEVAGCSGLQAIEIKAQNLSSFRFGGGLHIQISLGETSQIKNFDWFCSVSACTELPSRMPNLETLTIYSIKERVNTPIVPSKFLHLKLLTVAFCGRNRDYFSLVSFFDASPSLEIFILNVEPERMDFVSVLEDPLDLRRMPVTSHSKLKRVDIINFSSARTLVEFICYILESTISLEHLILDTTPGLSRCSVNKSGKCILMGGDALLEAHRAFLAVQMYIKTKVPSAVELTILEPCRRCHGAEI